MKEYRIPCKFYWDHTYRDLPEFGESVLVRETRQYVIVRMDEDALRDLYSDARYYSDASTDHGMRGLAASARATVKAIDAQRKENDHAA